ncbi:Probable multidrug resistance-associated protein lethal(2)03659 [Gryllus bimaculatus]|nr:Probable multidrug resistance-associated protein lethal(2)03659 [Gryllus bimaculatus]
MDGSRRTGARPCARELANPLSAVFFGWTWRIFRNGLKRDFTAKDLDDPLSEDQSQLLADRLEREWRRQVEACGGLEGKRSPSLLWAIVKVFAAEYILLGLLVFTHGILLGVVQPLLLGLLLDYFAAPAQESRTFAFLHAGGIVGSTALNTLLYSHYALGSWQLGMRMRTACCAMLYRKALRLSQTAMGGIPVGQIVNLLSNDVGRFDKVTMFLHYLWLSPLLTTSAVHFMYLEVGWPAFVGAFTVLAALPLQGSMSHFSAMYRSKTAYRTDYRVRLVDNIVSGIRAIKMYAWEKPFIGLVNAARRREIGSLRITSYVRGLYMTLSLCTTRTAFFCTMIVMALYHENLTSRKIFVLQSYFNVLSHAVSVNFGRGLTELAEVRVSIKRIQEDRYRRRSVLSTCSEQNGRPVFEEPSTSSEYQFDGEEDFAVSLNGVSAKWEPRNTKLTLDNINVFLKKGTLTAVIGPVGSGKAILGELPPLEGGVVLRGRVSYASQEPWVFAGTVRQNILFGRPLERARYEAVLRACVLHRDLAQLPRGDLTLVGDQGVALSGGQRARLNLARALYRDADIYLLDEPLAALDTCVAQELFEKCICKFLANKTTLLVTNHLHYAQHADLVISMDRQGCALAGRGDLKAFSRPGPSSGVKLTSRDSNEKIDIQVLPSKGSAPEEDTSCWAFDSMEESSKGQIQGKSVYKEYVRSGSNICINLTLAFLFLSTQILVCGVDYFVSLWTYQDELRVRRETVMQIFNESITQPQFWYNLTNHKASLQDVPKPFLSLELSIIIYASLIFSLFTVTLVRSFAFFKVCMRCSSKLHERMFLSVLKTRISFFDSNPAGRILNRFTKDMGTVDEVLPRTILNAIQIIMQMMGSIALTLTANFYLPIPVLVMGIIFWYSTMIYLKTSNNLKRIEGMTKSPVFSHFHATMRGLPTVRANDAQGVLCEEFDKHQDLHTSAWYTFMAASTAFGFFLDWMVCIFIGFITFGSLFMEDHMSVVIGGHPGLAITQCMALSGLLQWGVRQSAEVANNMMSVERIVEYSCLEAEPEPDTKGAVIDAEWPDLGMIKFDNVFVRYNETDPPAIRNLNILIQPGQKVGIVGRTGAGKSSLVAALFRLCWALDGRVVVDGVDTRQVPLHDLRSRIAIIPQEPLLFAGSMRLNLDPFQEHADADLLQVLNEASCLTYFRLTYYFFFLDLSVVQFQVVQAIVEIKGMFCVVSNTDALLQKTIREKFRSCTVLTVAHRLETVMDYDRILVVDAGRAVEFDKPQMLLKKVGGYLYRMVHENSPGVKERFARDAS